MPYSLRFWWYHVNFVYYHNRKCPNILKFLRKEIYKLTNFLVKIHNFNFYLNIICFLIISLLKKYLILLVIVIKLWILVVMYCFYNCFEKWDWNCSLNIQLLNIDIAKRSFFYYHSIFISILLFYLFLNLFRIISHFNSLICKILLWLR